MPKPRLDDDSFGGIQIPREVEAREAWKKSEKTFQIGRKRKQRGKKKR